MSASVHVDLFSRQPVTIPLATCASFFQAQVTPGSPHNLALSFSRVGHLAASLAEVLDPCCSVRALQADMRHRIVAAASPEAAARQGREPQATDSWPC